MSKVTACIFDLGNTLMSIPREFDEEECLARVLGLPDSDSVRSIIYRICDREPGLSVESFLEHFDAAVNPAADSVLREQLLRAWMESIDAAILSEGALSLLDDLRARGIRLALVSNTPPTSHLIVDRLGLRERFDSLVFSCDVGFLKPDPRIFQCALTQLGTGCDQTVVVGDKIRTDILGGAILGLKSILLETRMQSIVEDGRGYVDAIIPSLDAIRETRLFKETFS